MIVDKKVKKCNLVGTNGNAFALMGKFQSCARKEGWTKEEIKKVLDAAMSGDYNNLVATLTQHCENP